MCHTHFAQPRRGRANGLVPQAKSQVAAIEDLGQELSRERSTQQFAQPVVQIDLDAEFEGIASSEAGAGALGYERRDHVEVDGTIGAQDSSHVRPREHGDVHSPELCLGAGRRDGVGAGVEQPFQFFIVVLLAKHSVCHPL